MSNRELVIDPVNKLPEHTPLAEIRRQIEFIAGVKEGLAQSEREEGISAKKARELIRVWTSTPS